MYKGVSTLIMSIIFQFLGLSVFQYGKWTNYDDESKYQQGIYCSVKCEELHIHCEEDTKES